MIVLLDEQIRLTHTQVTADATDAFYVALGGGWGEAG